MRRTAFGFLALAALAGGCATDADIASERPSIVERTCHSILERRTDGDIDWTEIEPRAGAAELADAYLTADGRHLTTSVLIRSRCKVPETP